MGGFFPVNRYRTLPAFRFPETTGIFPVKLSFRDPEAPELQFAVLNNGFRSPVDLKTVGAGCFPVEVIKTPVAPFSYST